MSGRFEIVYADPPWSYADRNCNGAAEQQYRTMPIDEICRLQIGEQVAANNCVLFMWGTYPLLPELLRVGAAWGFKYKSIAFQWVKRYAKSGGPVFGLGRWTRGNTEGCFLFTRGKPKRMHNGISQLIETFEPEILDAPIGRHSAKPALVRDRIVDLTGDRDRIELFARERAPGWEVLGNQAPQGPPWHCPRCGQFESHAPILLPVVVDVSAV